MSATDKALQLSMKEQAQYRCAGFVQAEIEKYADEIKEERKSLGVGAQANGFDASDNEDEGDPKSKPKANGHASKQLHDNGLSLTLLSVASYYPDSPGTRVRDKFYYCCLHPST